MRNYSMVDQLLGRVDKCLKALPLGSSPPSSLEFSTEPDERECLSDTEKAHSIALMRINHSGEVCAQALYVGQALVARDQELANQLYQAAEEEKVHLHWCARRLQELNGRRSYLNPIWAAGSLIIGFLAGIWGDKVSLGFLAETEEQVTRHLDKHLQELPHSDKKSRAILQQMREDEKKHATHAFALGGIVLPKPICKMMSLCSKIMTSSAAYF